MIWLSFVLGTVAARRCSRETVEGLVVGVAVFEIINSPIAAALWKGLTGGAQ